MRSFETAAESAGLNSAGPQLNSFVLPSNERHVGGDDARAASPNVLYDRFKSSTPVDAVQTKSAVAVAGRRLKQDDRDEPRLSDDQELSIRLVTRPSNTSELSPDSDGHENSTTAIVTAPASPDVGSTALPKMVELSEASFLRPGRNGNLSRSPSMRSGTVKAGSAARLATQAARRSPSPKPLPPSPAKPSPETAAASSTNGDASGANSIAASAQELAAKCWQEDATFVKREKIAEWLGGLGLVNRAARGYYFANFDFSGLRLDVAFRRLCDKLFLRAETQQIDRILAAFSQRYYECNPESVFGSADVIHSVVFSILLLNTDLHIAELQERMTRQQFVRNTLGAIAESSPDGQLVSIQDDNRSSLSVAHNDATRSTDALPTSVSEAHVRNSIVGHLGIRSKQNSSSTNLESSSDAVHSRPVTASSGTKDKDTEIETLLRDIYAAVKSDRILLPAPETGSGAPGRPSGTFSPTLGGRKKAGAGNDRMMALKRGSIRGIQGLLGGLGPSNTFVDPSVSPNASRTSIDSWGRPSQSLSGGDRDRMLSPPPHSTPGFASTLSQTIIKESLEEEAAASANTTLQPPLDDEDDDDQLALAGPPWAKEGSLTRKFYWESTGKRAKDKSWTEVFAVVSKGTLSMFRFNTGPSATKSGAVLGGGNWLSNATCLGEIPLAHSLANALPPPGYNRSRPHVFALTLPGGKVTFFQTGHEELVHEWVSTCNYWAARLSKEPLAGGVSNMEYGWNKVLPQPDDVEEMGAPVESTVGHGMVRDDRSVRSGRPGTSLATSSAVGYSTNERTFINEWRTPSLPTVPSTLSEERQLVRLEKQVTLIETDLTTHNELRTPMLHLYSPKGTNHAKALANWERKSNWLLQELVKYTSYVESLRKSGEGRAERRAKREVDEMVREGDAMLAQLSI
uniref:SEC7 domain-containing protein n=2 Tax=Kalmanozyma brasiliensis (strain GHG001) TaxID=1365824 RepID=V5E843_KALBG